MAYLKGPLHLAEGRDWRRVMKYCRANGIPYVFFNRANGNPGTWSAVDSAGASSAMLFPDVGNPDRSNRAMKEARNVLEPDGTLPP